MKTNNTGHGQTAREQKQACWQLGGW